MPLLVRAALVAGRHEDASARNRSLHADAPMDILEKARTDNVPLLGSGSVTRGRPDARSAGGQAASRRGVDDAVSKVVCVSLPVAVACQAATGESASTGVATVVETATSGKVVDAGPRDSRTSVGDRRRGSGEREAAGHGGQGRKLGESAPGAHVDSVLSISGILSKCNGG